MAEDDDYSKEHSPRVGFDAFVGDVKNSGAEILDDDEICDLIAVTRNPDISDEDKLSARNKIYESQFYTIPFAIEKYGSAFVPDEQLVGEAFETLNACIDAFDLNYSRKTGKPTAKFSTYLIDSLVKRLQAPSQYQDPAPVVRLPAGTQHYAAVMRRAWEELAQKLHREPTSWEWYEATAGRLHNPKQTFDQVRTHAIDRPYLPIGHSREVGNVDPDSLSKRASDVGQQLVDPDADTADEAIRHITQETVRETLSILTPREQEVIRLRYGLAEDGKELTYDEIAKDMGISRNRVEQIEAEVIIKLKSNYKTRTVLRDLLEK